MKLKTLLLALAIAALIAGAAFAYGALSERYAPEIDLAEQTGSMSDEDLIEAPDFTVEDANGNTIRLSDMRGKPVVLNFWASWCPPCKAEMPGFEKLFAELGDEVVFMMVDMTDGQRETRESAESFVREQGYTFPVYFDVNQEAAYAYAVRAIPTTLMIDRDGYVIAGAEGQLDESTLRRGIEMIYSGE